MVAPILSLLLGLSSPPLAIPLPQPFCSPFKTGCQSSAKAHKLKSRGQAFHVSVTDTMKLHLREVLSQGPQRSRERAMRESLRETQEATEMLRYCYTISSSQQRGLHLGVGALCVCPAKAWPVVSVP